MSRTVSYGRPFHFKGTKELLRAWILFNSFTIKPLVTSGPEILRVVECVFGKKFTEDAVRCSVFQQFAGGEDKQSVLGTVQRLATKDVGSILFYSAEQDVERDNIRESRTNRDCHYEASHRQFLNSVHMAASSKSVKQPRVAIKATALCDPAILAKATKTIIADPKWFQPSSWAGGKRLSLDLPKHEAEEWSKLLQRAKEIGEVAKRLGVMVYVDAEQTYLQPAIRHLVAHHLMPSFNKEEPIILNTVQCYLKSARATIDEELATAGTMGYHYGAKIVRGAYMDQERRLAGEHGYEDPVHPTKEETDHSYHDVVRSALHQAAEGRARITVASHNPHSVQMAQTIMRDLHIPKSSGPVSFGQLLGMGDHLTYPLGANRNQAYKIVPYGPVGEVVPYLMRRAQENSSGMVNADKERQLLNQEVWRRLVGATRGCVSMEDRKLTGQS